MVEDPLQLLRIKCIADEQGDGVLGKLTIDLKLFPWFVQVFKGLQAAIFQIIHLFAYGILCLFPKYACFPPFPERTWPGIFHHSQCY